MNVMKIPKFYYAFALFTCVAVYTAYVKWNVGSKTRGNRSVLENPLDNGTSNIYGIMFDAGSTGTRIHIFQFSQHPKEIPKLINAKFKAIKPGLSAYADDVDKSAQGINELLTLARETVPEKLWKSTPLVLKATAGLRLLPKEKAQQLLDKVKDIFQACPFLVLNDSISIMEGSDEGVSAWITVNYLTDRLYNSGKKCVGMLDLGGGSTQITFRPSTETTLETSSVGRMTSFRMFNTTYKLYSHSYLGLGILSTRLSILRKTERKLLNKELKSTCLSADFQGQLEHAKIKYKIKGQKAEKPLFESCFDEIAKWIHKKVHRTDEVNDLEFYAFSYYYDLAVAVGLIECKIMESQKGECPFRCMDLTYVSLLLEGLGFQKNHVLKLARKINGTETSWALGAVLKYMDYHHMLQY